MSEDKTRSRRLMFGCLGVFVGVVIAFIIFLPPWIQAFRGAEKLGLLEPQQMREYQGTAQDNLVAIQIALMQYHDSEGAFPPAEQWMDKITPYLKTADLTKEDAEKKLKNPLVTKENPLGYGFAYNTEIAGKFVASKNQSAPGPNAITDPDKTILVFDSSDLTKNAHGNPLQLAPNPERANKNLGITVSGEVGPLRKLLGR